MSDAHVHRTSKGRVVYNRRRHLMGIGDAVRISRFVILNTRERFPASRENVELKDDFFRLMDAIIQATTAKLGAVMNPALRLAITEILWIALSENKGVAIERPETETAAQVKEETSAE